ncbi:MAG TPA: hypothetical protein VLJ59_00155 [Mycobacteriales bacterium]|nr:hypothetical protein [Mycobacteriales bacterium]
MSVIVTRAVGQVRSAIGSRVDTPLFGLAGVLGLPLAQVADARGPGQGA